MSRVLVTGGFGFIASELVRQLVDRGDTVAVVDPLTYAADEDNLADCMGKFEHFVCGVEAPDVHPMLAYFKPEVLFHAAAESHVDRSLTSYRSFVETNITGTFNLVEAVRQHAPTCKFVYVSTDEVYGSLPEGRASEGQQLNPCNPYSVSKCSAEQIVRASSHTWGLQAIVTRSCNNFGPRQHPEKLMPHAITRLLTGEPIHLHGAGANIREWIYVSDNVRAMLAAADQGVQGETYNITTTWDLTNLQLVHLLANKLGVVPRVEHVPDRPGNDLRYAMTSAKLRLLGWRPEETLDSALDKTLLWYERNKTWWSSKLTRSSTNVAPKSSQS